MGILVFLFLILFFFWAILTIFEVTIISRMEVSTFKYIKLLKFLEFFLCYFNNYFNRFLFIYKCGNFLLFLLFTFYNNILWNINI